jgi:hypothetical protein
MSHKSMIVFDFSTGAAVGQPRRIVGVGARRAI